MDGLLSFVFNSIGSVTGLSHRQANGDPVAESGENPVLTLGNFWDILEHWH